MKTAKITPANTAASKIEITSTMDRHYKLGGTWVRGTYTAPATKYQYTFNALVFGKSYEDGIFGGRVKKLEIRNAGNYVIANYDGGWDVEPHEAHHKAPFFAILATLATYKH